MRRIGGPQYGRFKEIACGLASCRQVQLEGGPAMNARARIKRLEAQARQTRAAAEAKAGPLVLIMSSAEYEARKAEIDAEAGTRPVYIVGPEFIPQTKPAAAAIMVMSRPGGKP